MSPVIVWCAAAIVYTAFWLWYVGFPRKITSAEIESTL